MKAFWTSVAVLAACCGAAWGQTKTEAELIAVLKSDAPQQQKGEACIDLGRAGTKAAVEPLAALLGDEKLAHMARYALETIPGPAVDGALRAALGSLKGRLLVGAVQSVGVRRDAQAVDALAGLLGSSDPEVAVAASRALGRIDTPAAAGALKAALANRSVAAEGLLMCAEKQSGEPAAALYDAVRGAAVSPAAKRAATRGAILSRGEAGLPLLGELLSSDDAGTFGLGLGVAQELAGAGATRALADGLSRGPAWRQVRLCAVLGGRRDASAVPALVGVVRAGAPEAKTAAIRALAQLGDASAVAVLAELAGSDAADTAGAAMAALAGFPGAETDAAIAAWLDKPDAKTRRLGVELVGRRRILSAIPTLLRLAGDPDAQLASASLKVLGELADEKEIPALIRTLAVPAATDAAADALVAVCARASVPKEGAVTVHKAVYGALPGGPSKDVTAKVAALVKSGETVVSAANEVFGDAAPGKVKTLSVEYAVNGAPKQGAAPEGGALKLDVESVRVTPAAVVEPLKTAYAQAQGAPKRALLRVLCSLGGGEALAALRAATGDADAEIREGACRSLCEWPSADALPDLEKMIQSPPSPKIKILALRGYVRLTDVREGGPAVKAAALKRAYGWAERDEERRAVLASLEGAPCLDALAVAAAGLGQASLKNEACAAAVGLAEALVSAYPAEVEALLKKAVQAQPQEPVLKRAQALLDQIAKERNAAGAEEGFVPMFNGKDLSGWEQKGGAWWSAADGVLKAESTAATPLASNNHLIWRGGTPGDFEMRAEFRLSKSSNSGIQLRAEDKFDRDSGYQADMNGGGNFVGFLYHPKMHLIGGRGERVTIAADGKKEERRFADAAELQKLYKMEDWNAYRVVCQGPTITVYLNGALTTQVTDLRSDTPRQGVITLQLHKGPPMKIEYRNLRIKVLK